MAKTIVGLYDDRTTAHRVLDDLENAGFTEKHLRFTSNEEGKQHNFEVDANEHATPDALTRFGVADDESNFYAEGVRRGGSLIIARVHDQDVERAVDIMARHNPVRFEDRKKAYQEEGFKNYDASAAAFSADEIKQERERFADEATARMKEIEEHLKIGKREVVRGGVRVHKYVDTDIEEETLRLREEHVDVDRRRVDRAATAEDLNDAFEEKTIEMVERGEEAVVEKETRVVGEVAVGKEVNVREETVGGKVRSTRIEVENLDTGVIATEEPAFREHYASAYTDADNDYDYYRPAYEYGYAAGTTYTDRDYSAVEADLRNDYHQRHGEDSLWDDVKDAVRHGYNRAHAALVS